MTSTTSVASAIDATRLAADLFAAIGQVVRGKPDQARLALAGLLAGGHVLIEDIPGVGKTILAKSLARAVGGRFRRVQGTPDLLPADLTGVTVYSRAQEKWDFQPGPIFAHVLLIDEINRATPRTQSATLEAMEERQVTVDGKTYRLPQPFMLIATQNPFEHHGTFPLVEGQRDRFSIVIEMGMPNRSAERELLSGRGGKDALAALRPVTSPESIQRTVMQIRDVRCDEKVANYILDLAEATRNHPDIALGASPRASLSLLALARAHATIVGRRFVAPDDVKEVAAAGLAHRLVLVNGDLGSATQLVRKILGEIPVPLA